MTQWGLDTLFNPAKRHVDEEKRRLQATREEIGDSSGGKRIDLESGKVTIRRSGAKPTSVETAEADEMTADAAAATAEPEGSTATRADEDDSAVG